MFRVALEFAALVPALTKSARPALRDQIERASSSIALLVAEGNARHTRRDRHHFFSMAQGCWTSPLHGLVHLTGPSALASAMGYAALDAGRLCPRPVCVGVRDRCLSREDATAAKHKLTRIVQMLVGLRRR